MCFVHWLELIIGPAIYDYKKRLILLSVIPLCGEHCIRYEDYQYNDSIKRKTMSAYEVALTLNVIVSGEDVIFKFNSLNMARKGPF
jgi:hypothetical protein